MSSPINIHSKDSISFNQRINFRLYRPANILLIPTQKDKKFTDFWKKNRMGSVKKSEEEWQAILTPEQYHILRKKGTEPKGTGHYDKFYEEGIYNCAGCGTPLYKSTTKFNSGCGWPAFFEGLPGAINRSPDPDGRRTEITCVACGGHLGHVFKGEGHPVPTDERHCVNSVSIKFVPASAPPTP